MLYSIQVLIFKMFQYQQWNSCYVTPPHVPDLRYKVRMKVLLKRSFFRGVVVVQ